ncbi:MAG: alanine racemase [Rhodomicrobium sp.]|nr:alanine racemase [Rhodomicrobium sp.]
MDRPDQLIGRQGNGLSDLLGGSRIPASATGVLAVDLDAIIRNYRKLRMQAHFAECAAVMKANGYGLGAVEVSAALAANGCNSFFVATVAEGAKLRRALPDGIIYVLDGLLPGSASDFKDARLRPVLNGIGETEEWSNYCRSIGQKLPAAIHFDTGMNRLGLKVSGQQRLAEHLEILSGFTPSLLMSHLACADTPESVKNAEQLRRFGEYFQKLPVMPLSLANSAGIFLGADYCFDLVRPGIALYGGNPLSGEANPMEPVVTLYGRIAQLGQAQEGETIGYGAARTLKRPTRFATVTAGYADGYFRSLGSTDSKPGATAYIGNWRLPVLGRVSMDLIAIDITDTPSGAVERGGFVELLGKNFTVDDAAKAAGTIPYEILTGIGQRYNRVYLQSGGMGPSM